MAKRATMAKANSSVSLEITKNNSELGNLVRRLENNFINGKTKNSKYVEMSMYEDLNKIDAYLNSKHVSGEFDSLGRKKPFFNIVTAAVNIWFRATDISRKNINIRATQTSDMLAALLATIHLQDWMKVENFGAFLKDWGRSLARYGSSVVKFVEQDGKLHKMVVSWNRLIVDSIDFDQSPVIEILEMTEAQLRMRPYDKVAIDVLCEAVKQARETTGREKKDDLNYYIKLYEVHGMMPLSYITDKSIDSDIYVQQMHVISFLAKNGSDEDFDDFTLVKGREKQSPYMLTSLIKEDGQTLAIGAVQHLFQAQWMANHTAKAIKDQLDLASKLIFQTSDGNFVGQNALTAIETGDIMIHAENQPLTQVENNSHDITSLQNYGNQWIALAKDITSTPDAISGTTMPSGTAYRQVAILNQESHSLFEVMTENKGLDIEQMLRLFIIPFLKKQMNNSKEIGTTLNDYQITQVDRMYIPSEVAKRISKKTIASLVKGQVPKTDIATETQGVQAELQQLGNARYFVPSDLPDKTWADIFDNFEWTAECEITPENTDKEADLATLNTVLQTIAANPQILVDPNAKLIFNKILEMTGQVSPMELQPPAAPTPVANVPTPFATVSQSGQ